MDLSKYKLSSEPNLTKFEFTSEGVNGNIEKIVIFESVATESGELFNLCFGDKNPLTGELDDTVNSNNGDRNKVLATVALAAYLFTDTHTNAVILMQGATDTRTRLYQMAINIHYDEIKADFNVFGLLNDELMQFEKNVNYGGFLIKRKQIIV